MKRYAISNSSIPSVNSSQSISTRSSNSDLNINMKKHRPNNDKTFIPIQPVAGPSMMVTAPKGQLYIPGKDVSYDYDYKLNLERNELRRQQDEKNKELSKRINTRSPYYDDYGNPVRWIESPSQDRIETAYSRPMEIDPTLEIGGYKKRRNKRRSNKKKRKSKRKSLKKRRKTRRK